MANSEVEDVMRMMKELGLGSTSSSMSSSSIAALKGILEQEKEKKAERKLVIKPALQMDVLFVLDATVSMKPHRDVIVKHLEGTVDMLAHMLKHSTVRVGVVAYRDFKLSPRFELLPFTTLSKGNHVDGARACEVKNWLGKLQFCTSVSQDFPEDVHGGLEKAASQELGWSSSGTGCRTLIHIADAPGHGKRLRWQKADGVPEYQDDHPDYDSDGSELQALILKLRDTIKVDNYAFIHAPTVVNGVRHIMTSEMVERLREASGDPAWVQDFEWNETEFPFQIIESVCESVRNSISIDRKPSKERKHNIVKEEPDWSKLQERMVSRICKHRPIYNITELLKMIKNGGHHKMVQEEKGTIVIAPEPFACGKSRLVYYGRYYPEGKGGAFQEVVLKEFISTEKGANTAASYKAQMETHTVASTLADLFNQHARFVHNSGKGPEVPEVKFVDCIFINVRTKNRDRFMLMEQLCLGEHVKYNNNCGSVNFGNPQPHLQAFSHWTYEVTNKQLMVVDVQGFEVINSEGNVQILLSDPAVHSVSRNHFISHSGNMNLLNGPDMFLHSHLDKQINAALQLHGPVCEALIPMCKDFRKWQDKMVQSGKGNGRVKSFNLDLDSVDSQSSSKSTCTISRRLDIIRPALKVHAECRTLLKKNGVQVPNNLAAAISICFEQGLVDGKKKTEWDALRLLRNRAEHEWL